MKVKGDFITNSSSTSFIIWGVDIEENKLKEKGGDKLFELCKIYNHNLTREDFEDDDFDLYDYIDDIAVKYGLDCFQVDYVDTYKIGKSPFDMKDYETLNEFKMGIIKSLHEMGLTHIGFNDIEAIEECSYEG